MKIISFIKICTILNIFFLTYLVYFYSLNNFFPPPIHYNPIDFFGDFFNTIWWALNGRYAYTIWHSVYHPFFLMTIIGFFDLIDFNNLITNSTNSFKSANIYYMAFFSCLVLILSVVILFFYQIKFSKKNSKEIYFFSFMFFSSPVFIFTAERLNLIFLSIIPLFYLIYSDSRIVKSLQIIILTLIKPYFFALITPFFFKDRFYFALVFALLIFILVISCDYFNISIIDYFKNYILFLNSDQITKEQLIGKSLTIVNYSPNLLMSMLAYENLIAYKFQNIYFLNYYKIIVISVLMLPAIYYIFYHLLNMKKLSFVESYLFIITVFVNFFPQSYNYFLILYLPFMSYIFGSNDKKLTFYFILFFSIINGITFFSSDINYAKLYNIDFLNQNIYTNVRVCSNILLAALNYLFFIRLCMILKNKYQYN